MIFNKLKYRAIAMVRAETAPVAYNSSANALTLNLSGGTAVSVAVASGASHGTASASGTSITYTPTSGYSGPDSFTYTATNAGGTSTPGTVTITVNALANAITFNPLPSLPQGSAAVTLVATATSGDTVIFTSTTPLVCAVSGNNRLTLVAAASGTCTVVASDPGNAIFAAATPVSRSFGVTTRFDPSKDTEVVGIVTAQTQAAEQSADVQMQNFNSRLEQMHGDGYVADNFGVSLTDGLDHDGDQPKPTGYADDDMASKNATAADQATSKAMRKQNRQQTEEDKVRAASLDRAFSFWTAGRSRSVASTTTIPSPHRT